MAVNELDARTELVELREKYRRVCAALAILKRDQEAVRPALREPVGVSTCGCGLRWEAAPWGPFLDQAARLHDIDGECDPPDWPRRWVQNGFFPVRQAG